MRENTLILPSRTRTTDEIKILAWFQIRSWWLQFVSELCHEMAENQKRRKSSYATTIYKC